MLKTKLKKTWAFINVSPVSPNETEFYNISSDFQDHLKNSTHSFDTHIILFDYHYHCRGGKTENLQKLIQKAKASIENFGFFVYKDDQIAK